MWFLSEVGSRGVVALAHITLLSDPNISLNTSHLRVGSIERGRMSEKARAYPYVSVSIRTV